MKSFDQEAYLSIHVPYRMQSIAWFVHVLRGTRGWTEAKRMEIYLDGKRCIVGNHRGLTNPSIEVGIVYSRVLLEFLGLRANREKNALALVERRRPDTIGIEDFTSASGPLQKVTVQQALACYPGPAADAEASLVTVIAHADKAVAHMTEGPVQDERTADLVALGGEGVLALVSRYLYRALGRSIPDYTIKVQR